MRPPIRVIPLKMVFRDGNLLPLGIRALKFGFTFSISPAKCRVINFSSRNVLLAVSSIKGTRHSHHRLHIEIFLMVLRCFSQCKDISGKPGLWHGRIFILSYPVLTIWTGTPFKLLCKSGPGNNLLLKETPATLLVNIIVHSISVTTCVLFELYDCIKTYIVYHRSLNNTEQWLMIHISDVDW